MASFHFLLYHILNLHKVPKGLSYNYNYICAQNFPKLGKKEKKKSKFQFAKYRISASVLIGRRIDV